MYIVLMAGGSGTRFWPFSRRDMPKQLLKIAGDSTMIQETYNRVKGLTDPSKILVITAENLSEIIQRQLPDILAANIITEPVGRNTAPCIALAAAIIKSRTCDPNETMVVLPADHLVNPINAFQAAIKAAETYAIETSMLVTLGIRPLYPETGYGYIQSNTHYQSRDGIKIFDVKTFAEKPNEETARRFIESGDFYWNSGIFIWKVERILAEFEKQMPDLYDHVPFLIENAGTDYMPQAIEKVYSSIKSKSIDYGIMEKATGVAVAECLFAWNDVGSWEAVFKLSEKDKNDNVMLEGVPFFVDSKDNLFFSESKKLIAAVDIENIVCVETKDAILLCKKDKSQHVKNIVERLKIKDMDKFL